MVEMIFKIAAIEMMTSLIILILLKNYVKNDENMFFSKINLVIFKIFFQLFKFKIA